MLSQDLQTLTTETELLESHEGLGGLGKNSGKMSMIVFSLTALIELDRCRPFQITA